MIKIIRFYRFLKSKKLKFNFDFQNPKELQKYFYFSIRIEEGEYNNWGLEMLNFKIYFYSWSYDENSNAVKYLQEFCNKYNYDFDAF